jgi:hypothetical protein
MNLHFHHQLFKTPVTGTRVKFSETDFMSVSEPTEHRGDYVCVPLALELKNKLSDHTAYNVSYDFHNKHKLFSSAVFSGT